MQSTRGSFIAVAAQRPKARSVCKGCRRRRQVNKLNCLCSQCESARVSTASRSPPTSQSVIYSSGSETPSSTFSTVSTVSSRSSMMSIDDGALHQIQLLSNFLETQYPLDSKLESDMHRKLSYLTVLPSVDISSPLLSSAVNSLCLAYVGSKEHDSRLIHASRDSYGHVLGSLVQALRLPAAARARSHREVIASIMLLSLYEDSIPQQSRSAHSFTTHFTGALRYIEDCGPSCLDLSTLFDTRLLQNLRMPALVYCIASRKSFVFARKEWRDPDSSHFQSQGSSAWFPLMSPLPDLLERADSFLDVPDADEAAFADLYEEMSAYRNRLMHWIDREFQGLVGPARKGVGTVETSDLRSFDMTIEEHCFITTSETFETFHRFIGGAGQVLRCSLTWFALFILDVTFLRLHLRNPLTKKVMRDRPMPAVEQDTYKWAVEMCRCVWNYSVLSSLAYAEFLPHFIQAACNFFEDYGALREMGWCQACIISTNLRLRRIRHKVRPTLCRVRDVGHEISPAGRYRSRRDGIYET